MVRFKNRYITIEVIIEGCPKQKLNSQALSSEVFNKVKQLYGDYGSASIRTGFSASYCNELTKIAILRVRHGPHKFVTSSLPLITKIGKENVRIRIIYLGGTLHQCYKRIVRHQRSKLDGYLKELKTEEEKKLLESKMFSFGGLLENQRV